jgi:hypothetical protein
MSVWLAPYEACAIHTNVVFSSENRPVCGDFIHVFESPTRGSEESREAITAPIVEVALEIGCKDSVTPPKNQSQMERCVT